LNCAVPVQSTGGVGIVATEGGIPGIGDAVVGVSPAHRPTVNGGSAIVGDTDSTLKAGIPFIVECVRADRCVRLARDDHAQA
jgi:hypothetical protein